MFPHLRKSQTNLQMKKVTNRNTKADILEYITYQETQTVSNIEARNIGIACLSIGLIIGTFW